MEIKHFAGYGKVTAKKIADKKHTLHVRVEGNHERGIALRENDTTAMFDWLVQKFDKKAKALGCVEWAKRLTDVNVLEDYSHGVDVCDYLFDYDECDHENTKVVVKKETYKVLGDTPVTIMANVRVCIECGRELFDMELDSENLKRAYSKYKVEQGLLTAEEIKAIRENLGIEQSTMDKLLQTTTGMTRKYESGAVQSKIHDMTLRLLKNKDNVKLMAETEYLPLTKEERAQLVG